MSFKKCPVVMLPTNEKAQIIFVKHAQGKNVDKLRIPAAGGEYRRLLSYGFEPQHLYFLSDDEIKEGDYFIYPELKEKDVWLCRGSIPNVGAKKIIATTDSSIACIKDTLSIPQRRGLTNHYPTEKWVLPQPSQSFIKKFVEEYNKGNIITEVMVEYNSPEICENPLDSKFASLKVNPKDNTITIRKVKNSWNKEEVIKSIKNFAEKFVANTNTAYKQKEINEWIEENL